MRIGHGYDVHPFVEGRKLIIGGVAIPGEVGLDGHSDADVLIHAVCDACLGAAGLGDVGHHFPDSDARLKDVDSRTLLRRIHAQLSQRSLRLENLDSTIVAQRPRLSNYLEGMCANLADDLNVERTRVNVKATTTDHLGFIGRCEGIAAHAVVILTDIPI